MLMGSALVIAALALFLYNEQEDNRAGEAALEVMPQLVEAIYDRRDEVSEVEEAAETAPAPLFPEDRRMSVVNINGYGYIGFVGIPSLELELPVITNWDSKRLNTAPCRFWGDMYTGDLVIMAHNYKKHFGRISELRIGDIVTFTDMDAVTMEYEVVALDVLDTMAAAEMASGEYDLTLFTCTYGGQSRITVRCDRKI